MKYAFLTHVIPILFVVPTLVQAVCPLTGHHEQAPCEDDVDSPEIAVTPLPTAFPSASPSASPSTAPSPSPSTMPSPSPSAVPSPSPSTQPSLQPTSRPSSVPTEYGCVTQDGIFGNINSEAIRTIEYGYQIEASASADVIKTSIIGLVETAVTNSILGELFAECAVQRRLRVSRRRLEITGVSSNPDDVPVDDVICGSISAGNECVVVDGALSVYATTEASASELEDEILASIKENMDSGNFDDVHPSVVRVTYTELQPDKPSGSETEENNAVVQDNGNQVLIGSLVGAGVLMAVVLAVAYKRRANMAQEDGTATNLADQNTATS